MRDNIQGITKPTIRRLRRTTRDSRQQRLDLGPVITKYHNTDADRPIINSQKMKRGSAGWVGGGIYFADTEAETLGKTKNKGRTLQATVRLGRTLEMNVTNADSNMTYSKLQSLGYDSVKLTGPSTGDEYVVYNSDQVSEIDYAGSRKIRTDTIQDRLATMSDRRLAGELKTYMPEVVTDACTYCDRRGGKKTVNASDVRNALRDQGKKKYTVSRWLSVFTLFYF